MSVAKNDLSSKLKSAFEFEKIADILKNAIDVLTEDNPSLVTTSVEKAISQEIERRSQEKLDREAYERAMVPIEDYIEKLVEAAMRDMIIEHEKFEIPGRFCIEDEDEEELEREDVVDEDGLFFSRKVMRKYELRCEDSWKDEWSEDGQFSVSLTGKIYEQFKAHNFDVKRIEIDLPGEGGLEFSEVTSLAQLRNALGGISIFPKMACSVSDLEALKSELERNPNPHILISAIKYSDRK